MFDFFSYNLYKSYIIPHERFIYTINLFLAISIYLCYLEYLKYSKLAFVSTYIPNTCDKSLKT